MPYEWWSTMQAGLLLGGWVLPCLVWVSCPSFVLSEFKLAFVTNFSLYNCSCSRPLSVCERINSNDCNCTTLSFSMLHCHDGSCHVNEDSVTIWYTSPTNVALLLNNSKVQHLSLVKCDAEVSRPSLYDYFAVQKLKRLTVSYPNRYSDFSHDILLETATKSGVSDVASTTIIHLSILAGKQSMKAYTVQTVGFSHNSFPFLNLSISQADLANYQNALITFVY
ncbi:uncharacterized protein si:ch73-52p7.1 [Polypterus senegalus]|uniref:uncharacterized protein si:ch73-52p7.1 n=1 Tax=Polypterus senegalus TaxID=55291 RepID=UPI0019654934|nr:uncharacterized protein si:ch73-52p7.1 [Polypterus senegalus]